MSYSSGWYIWGQTRDEIHHHTIMMTASGSMVRIWVWKFEYYNVRELQERLWWWIKLWHDLPTVVIAIRIHKNFGIYSRRKDWTLRVNKSSVKFNPVHGSPGSIFQASSHCRANSLNEANAWKLKFNPAINADNNLQGRLNFWILTIPRHARNAWQRIYLFICGKQFLKLRFLLTKTV